MPKKKSDKPVVDEITSEQVGTINAQLQDFLTRNASVEIEEEPEQNDPEDIPEVPAEIFIPEKIVDIPAHKGHFQLHEKPVPMTTYVKLIGR